MKDFVLFLSSQGSSAGASNTCTVRSESRCALIKTSSSIERTVVSKNWIKQLNTLLVLHFNRCLTTEYSEKTAYFNVNCYPDNQIYVPQPTCTATFRTHYIQVVSRPRWVWISGEMILTGEDQCIRSKLVTLSLCPQYLSHGIELGSPRWQSH
jgi:hypothetical protein